MKPNTALAFAVRGFALRQQRAPSRTRAARRWARACVAAIVGLSLLILLQYPLFLDFGIDRLLFGNAVAAEATALPGRMAPLTALSIFLLGLAVCAGESMPPVIIWTHTDPSQDERVALLAQAQAVVFKGEGAKALLAPLSHDVRMRAS